MHTNLEERFAGAFNAGDPASMTAMLSSRATAQVIGSDFPVEVGSEAISRTSFAYLLDQGDDPLIAEVWRGEGGVHVLLREAAGDRALDTAIRLHTLEGLITRVEYVVFPHQPEELQKIARAAGSSVRIE